jgi:hydrogenase maturation factor HypF (carbamoyltransferase family)
MINAKARVTGGIMSMSFSGFAILTGIGATVMPIFARFQQTAQAFSYAGQGASSVVEGMAQQEAALKQLEADLRSAEDQLFEYAKQLAEKSRSDAGRAMEDFSSSFQKAIDRYERLTNSVAQNFRLGS